MFVERIAQPSCHRISGEDHLRASGQWKGVVRVPCQCGGVDDIDMDYGEFGGDTDDGFVTVFGGHGE
jgi:hypothetical protein